MTLALGLVASGDRELWRWGCSECRGDDYADQDDKRFDRNCDGDETRRSCGYAKWIFWAPSQKSCIWGAIDTETWRLIQIWQDFKTYQVLPFAGDLLDQPAWVYQLIRFADSKSDELKGGRADREKSASMAQTQGSLRHGHHHKR